MTIESLTKYRFDKNEIWNPSGGPAHRDMRVLKLPPYHRNLILSIKRVGKDALGKLSELDLRQVCSTQDQLDDFIKRFPRVSQAVSKGLLTSQDFLTGIENINYIDDNNGYDRIIHLLPYKTKSGRILSSKDRIPVEEMNLQPKILSRKEKIRLINKRSLMWVFLAQFLKFKQADNYHYLESFDFFDLVKKNNLGIYLLNSGIEMFDFRLINPQLEEQEVSGLISIRAVSLFQVGTKDYRPRVILFYHLDRRYSNKAQVFVNELLEKHT